MVIVAVIQVLNVHVQEEDLDVAVSVHSDGPFVVSVVGVGPGVQWRCYLARLPSYVITVH